MKIILSVKSYFDLNHMQFMFVSNGISIAIYFNNKFNIIDTNYFNKIPMKLDCILLVLRKLDITKNQSNYINVCQLNKQKI